MTLSDDEIITFKPSIDPKPLALKVHSPQGRPSALVVVLHGYGADERDMIPLAQRWASLYPHAVYGVLRAPYTCLHGQGFQWFSLEPLMQNDSQDRLAEVAQPGLNFVGEVLEAWRIRLGLSWDQVSVAGFSQGAFMALHFGLMIQPVKAVLAYAGGLMISDSTAPRFDPAVFLFHGALDDVIPLTRAYKAQDKLTQQGLAVTLYVDPRCGHTCSKQGIDEGVRFLTKKLEKKDEA